MQGVGEWLVVSSTEQRLAVAVAVTMCLATGSL